jgi:hypothetical protein
VRAQLAATYRLSGALEAPELIQRLGRVSY